MATHRLRMISGLVIASLAVSVASALLPRATVIPVPVSITPSQYWEGNDGPWSSFAIRVGNPAQDVRVFPSTLTSATWVVVPEGCTSTDPGNCGSLRGGLFSVNASSTWVANEFFGLFYDSWLNFNGTGEFGFDTVGLSWQGSGGPTLNHTVVGGIADKSFYLGSFGLSPRPTNFTTFNAPQPSYLTLLKESNQIPSLSYGITAGAPYRYSKVLGSTVLGGYDQGRFALNSGLSFPFGPDQTRDLLVGIQTITKTSASGSTNLLPNGIYAAIDSTVAQMYLPQAAVTAFENAFSLTLDPTSGLYLVNDSLHNALLAQQASVVFSLGKDISGGQTVQITLPYASFDLTAQTPLVASSSRYFPLHLASNDSQYTLGRTFLQEAYLTADYERMNFSVAQCTWSANMTEHIIPICSLNSTECAATTNKKTGGGLSSGAIAGIVVGAVAILAIAALLIWLLAIRPRKRRLENTEVKNRERLEGQYDPKNGAADGSTYKSAPGVELDADQIHIGHELGGTMVTGEELHADEPPPRPVYEMPGDL
ncbi:MAG: Acid protease [Lasallia pustulata]|uniref:Acid protease n=1 Tax=Lasallia pustulata TaxID=136370 RepID=A0A5M8PFY6_9LECA|nr:MAG: Acid protease [Lasallia pustulata]